MEAIIRSLPVFADLRAFLDWLETQADLVRISEPVGLRHEMTAVQVAALRKAGPVLRFDAAMHHDGTRAVMPVVANLFGTQARVAAGLGLTRDQIPDFGEFLASLRNPAPVEGMRDAWSRWPMLRAALLTRPLCRCPDYADVGLQVLVSGGDRCEGVGIIRGLRGRRGVCRSA
jgi:4-hydroxy-3-polyprenylbenzoate decarboxylase